MMLKVEDSVLEAGTVFKDDVRSSLLYIGVVTWAQYQYECLGNDF
jgi:hypothetical protein